MSTSIVQLSPEYFPSSSIGRPLALADIYVGIPDLDPAIVANQKQLSVQQEDGTVVAVTQPISTSAGGVPLYDGSPVTLLVSGDYSLKVLASDGSQEYYVPSRASQALVPGNYYYPDYNETDHGAAGDGNSVFDIIAEVGAVTKATMYFAHNSGSATTTYTFGTDETITNNFNVIVEAGALLSPATAKTLTINGPFDAGFYRTFSGAGTIVFGNDSVEYCVPQWWFDGGADYAAAADLAFAQSVDTYFPGNTTYAFTSRLSNITVGDKNIIFGGGAVWSLSGFGASIDAFLQITANRINIYNITIDGNSVAIPAIHIGVLTSEVAARYSSVNIFGAYIHDIGSSDSEGDTIRVLLIDDSTYENIKQEDTLGKSISFEGSRNCTMRDASAITCGGYYAGRWSGDNTVSEKCLFDNVYAYNPVNHLIKVSRGAIGTTVINSYGYFDASGTYNGPLTHGIFVQGGADTLLENNRIYFNDVTVASSYPIRVQGHGTVSLDVFNTRIIGNDIRNIDQAIDALIYVKASDGESVTGVEIVGNDLYDDTSSGVGIFIQNEGAGNTVSKVIVRDNQIDGGGGAITTGVTLTDDQAENVNLTEVDVGVNFFVDVTTKYAFDYLYSPFDGLATADQLLNITKVSFAANGDTVLYTVPANRRCFLTKAVIVAAANANSTDITIGQNGAENDFVPTNQMDNLNAQYDAVIVKPVPNTTPLKTLSYAGGTVIEMNVANQNGAAGNTVYLFGVIC